MYVLDNPLEYPLLELVLESFLDRAEAVLDRILVLAWPVLDKDLGDVELVLDMALGEDRTLALDRTLEEEVAVQGRILALLG